jgi:DmsE family decaheme c-type cytochrome
MILGLILGHQGDAVTRLLGVEGVNGRFNSRLLAYLLLGSCRVSSGFCPDHPRTDTKREKISHFRTVQNVGTSDGPVALCGKRARRDKKQEFTRTFHHRVNEGLVKCTDCHNPHGGFLTRQLRASASQDTVCYKCHSDKAGPFVYEHESVKIEGYVVCHTPHGSSNARTLRRAQVNAADCVRCLPLCRRASSGTWNSPLPVLSGVRNPAGVVSRNRCRSRIAGVLLAAIIWRK